MAIPKFLEDLAIISKLGDNPGSDNNLTTSAFRAKFDEAALKIQTFINDVLIPEANAVGSPQNGLTMQGGIDMNGKRLNGLTSPIFDDEAVNWGTVKDIGKAFYVNATLSAASWAASETAGFTQSVTVDSLTDSMKVSVSPSLPVTLSGKLVQAEELSKINACTRSGNTLTFEAWEEKPVQDIPIIVEVVK